MASYTGVGLSTSAFLSELLKLATDIVWKNQVLANIYEDSQTQIEEEIFISAKKGTLTFDTIFQLDEYTLQQLGYNATQIEAARDDKYYVPKDSRATALSIYVSHLIQYDSNTGHYVNYDEPNNYYRMLNGLPDVGDNDFIYQTKYDDISKTTPIHLLPLVDRYTMEANGYLDTLASEYPKKKYIKYLASKQINPYNARIADRFSILWMNTSEYSNLYSDFRDIYNKARYNVIRVYYSRSLQKENSSYESFMAMVIDFMTISLMHYKYLDADITRDFYDLDSIKYIYDSYQVPYYSSIPLDYHKKIVKNINRLLGYKGSTRVFYELFDIFNYSDIAIYEYYIMRTRKFVNNKPVFAYKTNGEPDNEAMYTIKFGKVKLYDDPPMELSNPLNHISYNAMVQNDPYWVSDPELLKKLYDEDFNYLETKYVGIQTVFDLYKILFESCYFFKMLLDNRKTLLTTTIYYNNINGAVNLFDLTIYLCTLICKKYGYEGNLPLDYASVAKVMGYDFTTSLTTVRNTIMNNKYLKSDSVLLNIFTTMNVNSLASVNTTYEKITKIESHITEMLSSIRDRNAWFAYYNLYNTIMTSNVLQKTYTKQDGTQALTFSDLLSDINIDLYIRESTVDLDIDTELESVLVLFKKSFSNLRYIEYADGIDVSSMIEHLFKILEFFKSAKSELTGYNIVYTISQRGVNYIKYIDELSSGTFSDRDTDSSNSRFEYLIDNIQNEKYSERARSNFHYLKDECYGIGGEHFSVSDTIQKFNDKLAANSIESFKMNRSDADKEILIDTINKDNLSARINNFSLFSDELIVNYERYVK